jgi:YidC/Oxa1 family membrane protein insertase
VAVLDPLNNVVAWVIMRIHAGLGALFGASSGWAWGLSIAILVIIIRLLLVPLFVKQVKAQRKMAQHAPHLQELRKKYKGDKQRLNEETMKFYKENGVNPLAGCLPMIPQMIVFFSLFSVLRAIADWKRGVSPAYGLTQSVVESAQKATIFGVHLDDKLLFAHPTPPFHIAIVIALTVVISATTTFMTVRQSAKRGLMQTNVDPDNPMAQSQKYMQYIVPFFSLTGLYWQYGLVLYWVTTNLWTLGQQYFMFRNWEPLPTTVAGATAAANTGAPARTAQSSFRSGAARSGSSGQASARPANGAARTAGAAKTTTAAKAAGTAKAANGARNGTSTGRTSPQAAARIKAASASSGTRSSSSGTRSSSRPATTGNAAKATPDTGQSATPKRGLLGLGRAKPEPEPQDDVPTTRVVRQQPVRQAKSKRSGKR